MLTGNLPHSWDRVCFCQNCCSLVHSIWNLLGNLEVLGVITSWDFRYSYWSQSCIDIESCIVEFLCPPPPFFLLAFTSPLDPRMEDFPSFFFFFPQEESFASSLWWMDGTLDFSSGQGYRSFLPSTPAFQGFYSVRGRGPQKSYSLMLMCFLSGLLCFQFSPQVSSPLVESHRRTFANEVL